MRTLLTISTTLLLLTGCSKTTAFDFFKMDEAHERAVSNLRTDTIVRSFETKAIISSVYLNRVDAEKYHGDDYFFISVYLPKRLKLYDKQGNATDEFTLTLNGAAPVHVEEVDDKDPLRTLMPVNNAWNSYYIVKYAATDDELMTLTLESDQYGTAELAYQRDEE